MEKANVTKVKKSKDMSVDIAKRHLSFTKLCKHLAQGYSIDCFSDLSDKSIKTYIKLYPNEFSQDKLDEAMRKGKQMWESIGTKQARGECLGNRRNWYYNMSNRYGWREKVDIEQETKGAVNVSVINYSSKKPPK